MGTVNGKAIGPSPAPPPSGGLLPNAYTAAFTKYIPLPGFLRIDVEVVGGDAYLQITEWVEPEHWEEPVGNETLLREGTHSIPLVRPAYGWRIRAASSTTGVTVNVRTVG